MCDTDHHDMALVVKVALNLNTTNNQRTANFFFYDFSGWPVWQFIFNELHTEL